MIKIDLITGFLGSGKTTFLKNYVSYLVANGNKVGVIENDFGAINIDMLILQDIVSENCDIEQIVGGSVVSDWKRRFKAKLISMAMCGYNRILVEPSGIFDVDAFFDMLYDEPLDRWYQVGNVFAIVDAQILKDLSEQSKYLLVSQIANAGSIILSKAQYIDQEQIEETKDILQNLLEDFKCDRQIKDDVYAKVWKEMIDDDWEKLAHCGWKKADHKKIWFDHKEEFQSVFIMDVQMSEGKLAYIIHDVIHNDMCGKVFRIKGFVDIGKKEEPEWIEINATKEEFTIKKRQKGQNVIIIIGENLDNDTIQKKFEVKE